jgi:hypothetical protein
MKRVILIESNEWGWDDLSFPVLELARSFKGNIIQVISIEK